MAKIYYRREDVDFTKFLFDNITDDSIVIVPDQFSFHVERESFKYLNKSAILGVEILGFNRLGDKILEKSGEKIVKITSEGKNMLLTKIGLEKKNELLILGDMILKKDMSDLLQDTIRNLKQSGLSSADFKEFLSRISEETVVYKKMKDILLIYDAFNEGMAGDYVDSQDFIDLYNSKILDCDYISHRDIWIYGFDAFDEKRIETIRLLNKRAKSLNIILTYEEDERSEIFLGNKLSLERLVVALEINSSGSDTENSVIRIDDSYKLERNETVDIIHERLFNYNWDINIKKRLFPLESFIKGSRKYKASSLKDSLVSWKAYFKGNNLQLVQCANPYNQAVAAASYVQHLVRDKAMRLRDIAIVSNTLDDEASMYKEVFLDFGFDLFIDEKRGFHGNPVFMYIKELLNLIEKDFKGNSPIEYLKNACSEEELVEDLELYSRTFNFDENSWKESFIRGEEDYGSEALCQFNQLREAFIEPALKLLSNLENKNIVEDQIKGIYNFLINEGNIVGRISAFANDEETSAEEVLEIKQFWGKIIDLIGQMIKLIGREQMPLKKTVEILSAGIDSIQVGIIPPNTDALIIGDSTRIKKGITKATLLLSANEGLVPKMVGNSSLIDKDDKILLENAGIVIGRPMEADLSQGNLDIYRHISSTTDEVYVSYLHTDSAGNSLEPSEIVNSLMSIFKDSLKVDPISEEDFFSLMGGRNILRSLILQEEQKAYAENRQVSPLFKVVEEILDDEELLNQISNIGKAYGYSPISIELIREAYLRGRKELRLSPSRLEGFGSCPFAHFMKYGIRPKVIKNFIVESSDLGTIYHQCIKEFSDYMSHDSSGGWSRDFTKSELKEKVESILDKIYEDYREGLLEGEADREYRKERILKVCSDSIYGIYNLMKIQELESIYFETSFGKGKEIPALSYISEDKRLKINIEGQIDRLDILPNHRSRVVDYKSGNDSFSLKESTRGLKLQLFIYLLASAGMVVESQPISPGGSFYYSLKECMSKDEKETKHRYDGFWHEDIKNYMDPDYFIVSNSRSWDHKDFEKNLDEINEKIQLMAMEIANGKINAEPKTIGQGNSCTYCDFKGVCKFDTSIKGCYYKKD